MIMNIKKLFYLVLVSFLLVSCATPLKESQLKSISTVGIVNQFDENPRYMIIGSTIFSNKVSKIRNSEFKSHLSAYVKSYLENAGYSVVYINEGESAAVDLLLQLRPTSVYQAEYMEGFGVVERFFLGSSGGPGAYISIAVDPFIDGKPYGTLTIYHTDKVTHVEHVEHLAETWEQLTTEQKQKIKAALITSIEEAVNDVLSQAGI